MIAAILWAAAFAVFIIAVILAATRLDGGWAWARGRHPTRLERHLRDDDDLIRDLRMLAASLESMERPARPGERQGPPDERQP